MSQASATTSPRRSTSRGRSCARVEASDTAATKAAIAERGHRDHERLHVVERADHRLVGLGRDARGERVEQGTFTNASASTIAPAGATTPRADRPLAVLSSAAPRLPRNQRKKNPARPVR